MLRTAVVRMAAAGGKKSNALKSISMAVGTFAAIGAGTYFAVESTFPRTNNLDPTLAAKPTQKTASSGVDFKAVRKDIAAVLEKDADYDGIGHYGPVLVRLAWHAAGSYDKVTGTGGSDGATMRFKPESDIGANAGLGVARTLLEPIKAKYGDKLSYGDLWTLAGVVAIKEMGGPDIKWRPGRTDAKDGSKCPPDGRLPDASKNAKHLRDIFYRMGFNDQEIVALSGAHALGKCHTDRSGYKGPWTFSPTSFTNAYFQLLLDEKWTEKKTDGPAVNGVQPAWTGPKQYADKTGELMMLPTDLELIKDAEFRKWVELYAKDQDKFFHDFAKAFGTLLELGCKNLAPTSQ